VVAVVVLVGVVVIVCVVVVVAEVGDDMISLRIARRDEKSEREGKRERD